MDSDLFYWMRQNAFRFEFISACLIAQCSERVNLYKKEKEEEDVALMQLS